MPLKNPTIRSILEQLNKPVLPHGKQLLPGTALSFSIRLLDLNLDLPIIYEWVNQPYAIPFWQMNGSFHQLEEVYQQIHICPFAQSLVGCLNGRIVCQLDIYDPFFDPIQKCYEVCKGDIGFYLLMAPGKKPVKKFTAKVVFLFLKLFFQSHLIQRVIGEPDEKNEPANNLLHTLSFDFIGPIQLPDKKANFYTITRQQFNGLATLSYEDLIRHFS